MLFDPQNLPATEQHAVPIAPITAPDNGVSSPNTALLRPVGDGCMAEDWKGLFDERAGIAEVDGQHKKTTIVALARKLLVAL
jgi:hypothetical protein